MIKSNIKNILIVFLIAIAVIILFVNKSNNPTSSSGNSSTSTNTNGEPLLPFGQITREDVIKHIEWAYKNGKNYQQFALEKGAPEDYVVDFYQPNFRDANVKPKEEQGGIIVFKIVDKEPQIFWETSNPVTLTRPVIETRDITNDGKVEILADWSDGTIDNLFIYSWTGSEFKFISPTTLFKSPYSGKEIIGYIFVVRMGDIQIKDIDNDNIDEVIISGGTTRDKIGNEIPIQRERIYKFNGQEYKLWKEEKVKS